MFGHVVQHGIVVEESISTRLVYVTHWLPLPWHAHSVFAVQGVVTAGYLVDHRGCAWLVYVCFERDHGQYV
jgi:hypothetical protein